MDRFFIAVARLNSVLFLVLLVGALVSAVLLWQGTRSDSTPTMKAQAKPDGAVKEFSFGRVEHITGTAIQLVFLTTDKERGYIASGGRRHDNVNLLFVHGDGSSHWFFPRNTQQIVRVQQLRADHASDTDPTQALLLDYIKTDSNNDGQLPQADLHQLVVVSVDGTHVTPLQNNVGQVLSVDMIGADLVSVLYQQAGAVRQARFSLQQMTLQSDHAVAQLPMVAE